MGAPRMKIAELDETGVTTVKDLEEQLGTYVVALEPKLPLAALTEKDMGSLQDLERELGVVLLAYEKR